MELFAPPQVKANVLTPAVDTVIVSEPEEALAPDHEPDALAEHDETVEAHVSVTVDQTRTSVTSTDRDNELTGAGVLPPPPPPPHDAIKSTAGRTKKIFKSFDIRHPLSYQR